MRVLCLVLVLVCSTYCLFYFYNHLTGTETSFDYKCSVSSHGMQCVVMTSPGHARLRFEQVFSSGNTISCLMTQYSASCEA